MKRKIDLLKEERESKNEESESSGDESEDEEARTKDVLSHLSQAVSVSACFWIAAKHGHFQRYSFLNSLRTIPIHIIPVTNNANLVEYVLLLHYNDITKPRALNTFLDGLVKLEVNKGLSENKKLLSDVIEKEKSYRNAENTSKNEINNDEESSADREE